MALFNDIAKLADLSFDAEVQLEHSQDVDRGALRVLFDAGLCPDRATLPAFIQPPANATCLTARMDTPRAKHASRRIYQSWTSLVNIDPTRGRS